MNKYTIIGVIVLMSISLLGVVGLQLYWINDAIQVKQAQFDHAVNEALNSAVDKLETREAVSVVKDKMQDLRTPLLPTTQTVQPVPSNNQAKPAPAVKVATEKPAAQPASPKSINRKKEAPKLKNRPAWVKLANGDSVLLKDPQFTKLNTIKYYNELPDIRHAGNTHFQVITDPQRATRILKQTAPAYQIALSADSMAMHFKNYNQVFDFSVDTLRLLASRLDSMKTFKRIAGHAGPNEFTTVRVQNDSIFLFRKGILKPVYVSSATASEEALIKLYSSTHSKAAEKRALAERRKHITPEINVEVTDHPLDKRSTKTRQKATEPKKSATEKLEQKTEKLNDVVQKMVVEYVAKDEPLQKRLNLDTLHSLLQTELQKQGINLPFGYWVVAGSKDTIAVKNIAPYTDAMLPKYKASLFPNDIFDKSDYLDLYFPDSKNYAVQSLWGMLALSGFFTLVIIATFGTTIHIIYKQKKLSEMKNDFINNMTHEFKTPIATISLATDAIANPKVYESPDKIQYYTNIIRQENKRMNAQVENVLQIALLEKNEFKMKLEPVDVHLLIIKAIESIRLQVEQRMGQINVQLDALTHELKSDEVHLYNVICNLLDNANKYSPAAPEINLTTQNVEGGILIAVDDKGMGMSKDTQQRVFEKFYRVPTGNLHNVKGFGLGLSYVKAIVQAHHGTIRLWSEPGKGSRFEIFLPTN
ncbi:ATP-binding protein [Pontibacter sp. H259]|uniref:sensor histidine kinase n=1 Tax=Pontibacter sp. H259 TaxID=3133421 RepID=UPI0030C42788